MPHRTRNAPPRHKDTSRRPSEGSIVWVVWGQPPPPRVQGGASNSEAGGRSAVRPAQAYASYAPPLERTSCPAPDASWPDSDLSLCNPPGLQSGRRSESTRGPQSTPRRQAARRGGGWPGIPRGQVWPGPPAQSIVAWAGRILGRLACLLCVAEVSLPDHCRQSCLKYSTSQYIPIQTMIHNVYLSVYFNIY